MPTIGQYGHDVRLMAPKFVSPYRMAGKTGKNDAADAIAICEVMQRPHMRFVPVKDESQQAMQCLHRTRQGFIHERTVTYNRLRGLVSEFGIIAPQSTDALCRIVSDQRETLPVQYSTVQCWSGFALMIYWLISLILKKKSPNMTGFYLVWPKLTIAASS